MQGWFRLRFSILVATFYGKQSNTRTIKIIKNPLFFQKLLAHSPGSNLCTSDYNSSFILALFLHKKTFKIISQRDTNRYPFLNQSVDRFCLEIKYILGAIWEAFDPLLVEQTRGLSKVLPLHLLTPISFNLESFLKHQP